jgi:hypothetical protein
MSKGLERSIARGGLEARMDAETDASIKAGSLFDLTVGVKTDTGKVAPDDSPIYREVFLLGDTDAGVDQALTMIGVIDTLITAYGATKSKAGLSYVIPYVGEDEDTMSIGITVDADGETVNVVASTVAELQGGWVVVEYIEA